jgi:hypothetical protein
MSNLTKQLLNTVLQDVTDFYVSDSTVYLNRTDAISANHCTAFGNFEHSINIYELAHKCKEWLYENDVDYTIWRTYNHRFYSERLHLDIECSSEIELLFKACQWVLDQKNNT